MVSYALLVFLAIGILISCLIYLRDVHNEVRLKYLKYNMIYLCIFLIIITLMFMQWILLAQEEPGDKYKDEDSEHLSTHKYSTSLMFARFLCEIGLFGVRLYEPGLRRFLKDKIRSLIKKFKFSCFKITQRSYTKYSQIYERSPNSCLNCTVLIDELKQEVKIS